MNQLSKSAIAVVLLCVIFLYGINSAVKKDITLSCQDDECLISLVIEMQNYSLCDKAQERDFCYETTSILSSLPDLCEFVSNVTKCYKQNAIYQENTSLCSKTENYDNCIFQIAISSLNLSMCNNSIDPQYCYFSYADFTKNRSLCNLSGKYNRSCFNRIG